MNEKIAILNKMIENYNISYGHTLTKIKDEDDIYDMKYDTEAVPRIFCSPDIAKIREFAKGQNIAELEIPGVKLTEERII